jgi:hypothetical protein
LTAGQARRPKETEAQLAARQKASATSEHRYYDFLCRIVNIECLWKKKSKNKQQNKKRAGKYAIFSGPVRINLNFYL